MVYTEADFIRRHEVTQVWYEPSKISLKELTPKVSEIKCADKIFVFHKTDTSLLKDLNSRLSIETVPLKNYCIASVSDRKKQLEKIRKLRLETIKFKHLSINKI